MSTNRPFLANFLAAFRAQSSTYKASSQPTGSSSLSSAQISQSTRAIATKASSSQPGSSTTAGTSNSTHATPRTSSSAGSSTAQTTSPSHHNHHSHHYHHAPSDPLTASAPTSPPPTPASSTPIPINGGPADRQRRGSDSSSGSGGFRDALGPEKWYIGGRTPAGEERFYRLGMVTKGGGRLGGSRRVGSIDQLSL